MEIIKISEEQALEMENAWREDRHSISCVEIWKEKGFIQKSKKDEAIDLLDNLITLGASISELKNLKQLIKDI